MVDKNKNNVNYDKLATLSFGAIKQLLARVEALEAK